MFAVMALLLIQAPPPDVEKLSTHELVQAIPSFGDHSWSLGREKERPLSIRAQDELRERIRAGVVLDLADWKTILFEKGYLQHRERWPKREPFAIGLRVPPICTALSLQLSPKILGWSKATAMDSAGVGCTDCPGCGYQELGPIFYSDQEVEFDLSVTTLLLEPQSRKDGKDTRTDHLGSIRIAVQAVRELEDAVPRVLDGELDARIKHLLSTGLVIVVEREAGKPARAYVRVGLAEHPKEVLLALTCTGIENGQARVQADLSLGTRRTEGDLFDLPESVVVSKESARGWTLKISGKNTGALREWDATQYWAGEIEVSLADLIGH